MNISFPSILICFPKVFLFQHSILKREHLQKPTVDLLFSWSDPDEHTELSIYSWCRPLYWGWIAQRLYKYVPTLQSQLHLSIWLKCNSFSSIGFSTFSGWTLIFSPRVSQYSRETIYGKPQWNPQFSSKTISTHRQGAQTSKISEKNLNFLAIQEAMANLSRKSTKTLKRVTLTNQKAVKLENPVAVTM